MLNIFNLNFLFFLSISYVLFLKCDFNLFLTLTLFLLFLYNFQRSLFLYLLNLLNSFNFALVNNLNSIFGSKNNTDRKSYVFNFLGNINTVNLYGNNNSLRLSNNLSYKNKYVIFNYLFILIDLNFVLSNLFRNFRKSNFIELFYKNNKLNIKTKQTNNSFIFSSNNENNYLNYLSYLNAGLKSIWLSLRFWLLGALFLVSIVYFSISIRLLPFGKVMFQWIMLSMFTYWLISGFVFFYKKYQYRYFTSVIQRFWRRTFIIFWSLESYLFVIFLYLVLNANQEPVYMYDNIQFYKSHLFSWRFFILKIFPITLLVVLCYFLLVSLKWNVFSQYNFIALIITAFLLYVIWLEFYQFFHILNFYGNLNWVYDVEEHLWNLETEFRRTRMLNHYVTICLIAKFWHLIFVVVFWIFFLLRGLESNRFRYPLLSANLQNFIILYIMSWLYMYPWFKFIFRRFMEAPYYWFYVNNRRMSTFVFFNDFKLLVLSIYDNILDNFNTLYKFTSHDYYYWIESTYLVGFTQYKKHYIRDYIISNFNL